MAMKDHFFYGIDQAVAQGPNALYLHNETDDAYVRQVTAEEKRINKQGSNEWVVIRKDNHLLDAEVLCISLAQPQWVGGGVNLVGSRKTGGPGVVPRAPGRRMISSGLQGADWLRG
jgi:hypothetical protein